MREPARTVRASRGGTVVGLLLGASLAVAVGASDAGAATIRVERNRDAGARSLRAAIDRANVTPGADRIVLVGERRKNGKRKKLFRLTRCVDPMNEENANADGDLDYTGAGRLVISGRNARVRNTCAGERVLENLGGSLVIRKATLERGRALAGGGGIRSVGSLTAVRTIVRRNRAQFGGGGISAVGPTLVLRDSAVTANASEGNGGGLETIGSATVAGTTVSRNEATFNGGGISKSSGTLAIEGSTLRGNRAGGNGGGLNSAFGMTTVAKSTVRANRAALNGGGISKAFGELATVNLTVTGNRAVAGSGGGLSSAFEATAIRSSTVTANESAAGAGGIQRSFDSTTIAMTIVAGNSGVQCSGVASLDFNLASDASCNPIGSDQPNSDPRLMPLANNGGPTLTHALRRSSPALNVIPAALGPGKDQRGAPRAAGNADVGAYERIRCWGIVVNRVGTSGADVLRGTRRSDGILALGGRDRLIGRKGRDGLCGGRGRDTLEGGAGNDRLDGEQGMDRCDGGPGRDRARACEATTRVP